MKFLEDTTSKTIQMKLDTGIVKDSRLIEYKNSEMKPVSVVFVTDFDVKLGFSGFVYVKVNVVIFSIS